MAKIAFIGLGAMGGPMAANLVRAGYEVKGFDLSPLLCEKAATTGVEVMTTARETMRADAVITMLPGGEHVLSVWNDLLPLAAKDTLFVDCSTIDMDSSRQAHSAASDFGVQSVDAPVSGGVAGARAGTLTFMCGGEEFLLYCGQAHTRKNGCDCSSLRRKRPRTGSENLQQHDPRRDNDRNLRSLRSRGKAWSIK